MKLTKEDVLRVVAELRKEKERQKHDPAYGYGTGIISVIQPSPLSDMIFQRKGN